MGKRHLLEGKRMHYDVVKWVLEDMQTNLTGPDILSKVQEPFQEGLERIKEMINKQTACVEIELCRQMLATTREKLRVQQLCALTGRGDQADAKHALESAQLPHHVIPVASCL